MKAVWVWTSAWLVWGLMLAAVLGYGGRSALFMLGAMTLILLQGMLARWAGPKTVTVRRRYSLMMPRAGQPVEMTLEIRLEGGLPPIWLKLKDEFGGGEPAEHWIFAGFRRQLCFTSRAEGLPRGLYGLEKLTVSHTDLLGWFRYKHSFMVSGLLSVLPVPARGMEGSAGGDGCQLENAQAAEERTVLSGPPGYAVRAYLPGDPLKAVNWKISARRGELTVRAPEEDQGITALILLDTDPASYQAGEPSKPEPALTKTPGGAQAAAARPDEAASMFERAVSAAAFLLEDAASRGHAVLFRHGGMPRLCRWNPHSLGEGGPAELAAARLAAAAHGGPEMLADAVRISPGVPVTVVTGFSGGRLSAAAAELGGRGIPVRLICCAAPQAPAGSADQPAWPTNQPAGSAAPQAPAGSADQPAWPTNQPAGSAAPQAPASSAGSSGSSGSAAPQAPASSASSAGSSGSASSSSSSSSAGSASSAGQPAASRTGEEAQRDGQDRGKSEADVPA
ncbi:DUF58 domain-containing protein [Paenibacillus pinistramenti]|uniref:DUF58 domain-containing protein n=1 Tax=Paenibacillus pinistramenti TaxID=1768003 RepID=UPI001109924C|nr:DUF58 domain-containing protein [Paenibacillus pinistramenti]